MDGVTILNEVMVENCLACNIIGIVLFSIIFILAVVTVILGFSYDEIGLIVSGFILGIICILGSIYAISDMNTSSYKKYEVTISDDVSFKDFTDKYEIIGQRGEIYVVKERYREREENAWNSIQRKESR